MKKQSLIIPLLLLILYACQKQVVTDASKVSTYASKINTSSRVDVYVAGNEENGSGYVAKYWKNGQAVSLTDGTTYAAAYSIFVSGNDVYACGNVGYVVDAVTSPQAYYWKNGNPVILGAGYARSIAVSGNDVYVCGYTGNAFNGYNACYWKNGNITYLPENTRSDDYWDDYPVSSTDSKAHSIFISGSDVYIAGQETIVRDGSSAISAVYWKNGNEGYLIKGSFAGSKDDAAYSIFVAGNDVYACGALEARYWKNGTSFYLPGSSGIITHAQSVFVSGSDVYVAGAQKDGKFYQTYLGQQKRYVAKYWKNGQPVNLTDGTREAYATSIAISGTDVYVAGYEEKQAGVRNWIAKYWKNGKPVVLGEVSKYSEAHSIFILKK
jgi:hypothetical protein